MPLANQSFPDAHTPQVDRDASADKAPVDRAEPYQPLDTLPGVGNFIAADFVMEQPYEASSPLPALRRQWLDKVDALLQQGHVEQAEGQLLAWHAEDPQDAVCCLRLGLLAQRERHFCVAVEWFAKALKLAPGDLAPHVNQGNAYAAMGDRQAAIACYGRALTLDPACPEALGNLGNILFELGDPESALNCYQHALEARPHNAGALFAMGNALNRLGRSREGRIALEHARSLRPSHHGIVNNLGIACMHQGDRKSARECFEQALALSPDYAGAHMNRAVLNLLEGRYEEGWREYEYRWKADNFSSPARDLSAPLWRGQPLEGKTILLYAEQGQGDVLQFVRYVPLVAARGARVVLEVQASLVDLLGSVEGVDRVLALGGSEADLPAHHYQCPLMSLPLAFGTTERTIPAEVPYLKVAPEKVARWRERIARSEHSAGVRPQMRIGLAWAGSPTNTWDRLRSLSLDQLRPLLGIAGCRFYSLQKGPAQAQLAELMPGLVDDLSPELEDFTDTAAAVEALDGVLSVDTVTAHLAGGLGRPVWLLLPMCLDWRWSVEGSNSRWYPTARLFRQHVAGEWQQPVAAMAEVLAMMVERRRRGEEAAQEALRAAHDHGLRSRQWVAAGMELQARQNLPTGHA